MKKMKTWEKPEVNKLVVKELNVNKLSIESALYASGGHRGELTR